MLVSLPLARDAPSHFAAIYAPPPKGRERKPPPPVLAAFRLVHVARGGASSATASTAVLATDPLRLEEAAAPPPGSLGSRYARTQAAAPVHIVRLLERVARELGMVASRCDREQEEAASVVNAMILAATEEAPPQKGSPSTEEVPRRTPSGPLPTGTASPAVSGGAWGDKLVTRTLIASMSSAGAASNRIIADVLVTASSPSGTWMARAGVFGLNEAAMSVVARHSELAAAAARAGTIIAGVAEQVAGQLESARAVAAASERAVAETGLDGHACRQVAVHCPGPLEPTSGLFYQAVSGELAFLSEQSLSALVKSARDAAAAFAMPLPDSARASGGSALQGGSKLPEWPWTAWGLPPLLVVPVTAVASVRATHAWRRVHPSFAHVPAGAEVLVVDAELSNARAGLAPTDGEGPPSWWFLRVSAALREAAGPSVLTFTAPSPAPPGSTSRGGRQHGEGSGPSTAPASRTRAELYRDVMGITALPDDPSFLAHRPGGAEDAPLSRDLADASQYPTLGGAGSGVAAGGAAGSGWGNKDKLKSFSTVSSRGGYYPSIEDGLAQMHGGGGRGSAAVKGTPRPR